MAAIRSFGVAVTIGGTAMTGLTDVQITGRDVTAVDTTTHEATGGAKTFVGGLIDNGTLEITGKFDGANAGIGYLEANYGEVAAVVVTYSDASTHTFSVVVGAPNVTNDLDGSVEYSCSSKITGVIAGTATS